MSASVEKLLNSQYVQLALAALAFLIALWFVVVIARMLMGGRLRLPGGRTRQARLGIVDAFDLDRQRQLIIVRRDNTEHLIMIGGPNDLLIESEIIRMEARDGRRDKGEGDPRIEGRATPRLGLEPPANGAPRPDEPIAPTLPPLGVPSGELDEADGQRAATFPLPPRRPIASPPPERRPQPERAARPVEPAMFDAAPASPQQPPPAPILAPPTAAEPVPPVPFQPVPFQPAPPQPAPSQPVPMQPADLPPEIAAQTASLPRALPPLVAPSDRPVPARPSPFLKPLPPRPPIRPLKRVTPQASPQAVAPPAGAAPESDPQLSAPPMSGPPTAAGTGTVVEPPRPVGPPPSAAEPAAKDGLESLEEEMAKLLGR